MSHRRSRTRALLEKKFALEAEVLEDVKRKFPELVGSNPPEKIEPQVEKIEQSKNAETQSSSAETQKIGEAGLECSLVKKQTSPLLRAASAGTVGAINQNGHGEPEPESTISSQALTPEKEAKTQTKPSAEPHAVVRESISNADASSLQTVDKSRPMIWMTAEEAKELARSEKELRQRVHDLQAQVEENQKRLSPEDSALENLRAQVESNNERIHNLSLQAVKEMKLVRRNCTSSSKETNDNMGCAEAQTVTLRDLDDEARLLKEEVAAREREIDHLRADVDQGQEALRLIRQQIAEAKQGSAKAAAKLGKLKQKSAQDARGQ